MEPSDAALRVLSTMFDAADEDTGPERHGGAFTIGATRPAEDCGCHNERKLVPMGGKQF